MSWRDATSVGVGLAAWLGVVAAGGTPIEAAQVGEAQVGDAPVGQSRVSQSQTPQTQAGPSRVGQAIQTAQVQPGRSPAAQTQDQGLVIYDFESSVQEWSIPDWAKESADYVGKILSTSEEFASRGHGSLQLLADFPGERWTGAYVEVLMHVTDWSAFGAISVDVYLPANAPKGLGGAFILTVGEKWTWTEMNRTIPLEPGKWTTITANLKPGSVDWKFFPDEAFRTDVRKVGIRIESNKKPVYSGPIYFDGIRLGS